MEQGCRRGDWGHRSCRSNWNYPYITCDGCQQFIIRESRNYCSYNSLCICRCLGEIKLAEYLPTQSAVGMLIYSLVISGLCSFLISGPPRLAIINYPFDLIKVVLGLGVLGTALAYPLYFKILELAGSSNLMLVTIIVPVFAIILDAILLGQFVTGSDLCGFALLAIGLFIMDGRLNYNFLIKG